MPSPSVHQRHAFYLLFKCRTDRFSENGAAPHQRRCAAPFRRLTLDADGKRDAVSLTVRGWLLSSSLRALRRRLLTPNVAETSLDKRGFHKKSPAAQERLETVGKTFLTGYAHAVEARTPAEAEASIEQLPDWLRGFAYEGAGMGLAMLDGLPFGRSDRVAAFLATPRGQAYQYLAYVGIGWAMARLPRFRWPKPAALDPVLAPLVLDGYGFHQAYFHTARYVDRRYQDPNFPWPGGRHGSRANNAIDQGIGRATWFIGGTDPGRVADLVDTFPEPRRADLWSGVGLAATYAGGDDPAAADRELRSLVIRAGAHRGSLAQGSAFAANARVCAGIVPEHSAVATRVLCGTTPREAARLVDELRPEYQEDGPEPAYEIWRARLAAAFAPLEV
jgi:enediyne biosynthesis protein E3